MEGNAENYLEAVFTTQLLRVLYSVGGLKSPRKDRRRV